MTEMSPVDWKPGEILKVLGLVVLKPQGGVDKEALFYRSQRGSQQVVKGNYPWFQRFPQAIVFQVRNDAVFGKYAVQACVT